MSDSVAGEPPRPWRGWTTTHVGSPVSPADDDFHRTEAEAVGHADWWNLTGEGVEPRPVVVVECAPDAVVLVLSKEEADDMLWAMNEAYSEHTAIPKLRAAQQEG